MAKGSQASRTITKRNNPFSGGHSGEATTGKQRVRSMDFPRRNDATCVAPAPSLKKETLSRSVASQSRTEHRTFYDDPVTVRQWAAETDPNTSVDFADYGLPETKYGIDVSTICLAPQVPGSFPVSCSDVSHFSFPASRGFQDDDFGAPGAPPMPNGMAPNLMDPLGLETYNGTEPMRNYETWSYPTPTAEDVSFSTCTAPCYPYSADSSFEPRFSDWPTNVFLPDNEGPREGYPCASNTLAWSPVLATDPSVSSSYSRSSYLAMQANTPLSPVAQEPDWPIDPVTCPEESGFYPAFSLGETFSQPAGLLNGQDPMSTVKPSRPFQRNPIAGMDFWTQEDPYPQSCVVPAPTNVPTTRRSSDVETTTTAREHPLYQAGPKEDGLYHCPFAGSEDCSHKPEKLNKHLDSHLKPYRCKLSTCSTLAFSSTACLLRHEREAHGMHGHGDKPHLCTYQDCERSIPGNGFPRRWNLYDHMRRVHAYTGSASSPGSTSPTPSSASSYCPGQATLALRKRRTSSPPRAEAMKKSKSNSSSKPITSIPSQGKQRQSMQLVFQQQKAAINARMAALDPTDALALEQINADCAILRTMAMNICSQDATQLAQ
ncbi:MAG: hypothetical protein Q9216_001427 [Gyalolechia sp. 2 TL-2023]